MIHGRVGSLLEVGTGFHQELSGRENIYLNGAILGMTRAEIGRKFDEIVAFSEIGEFLDTPVKRYSSGMFVRLAFAVAAHLEPEILLVDEVLAVGDLAVPAQVPRPDGADRRHRAHGLLRQPQHERGARPVHACRADRRRPPRRRRPHRRRGARLHRRSRRRDRRQCSTWRGRSARTASSSSPRLRVLDPRGSAGGPFHSRRRSPSRSTSRSSARTRRTRSGSTCSAPAAWRSAPGTPTGRPTSGPNLPVGTTTLRCTVPAGLLNEGSYAVAPTADVYRSHWIVNGDDAIWFEVIKDHSESPFFWVKNPGPVAPVLAWQAATGDQLAEAVPAETPTAPTAPSRPWG